MKKWMITLMTVAMALIVTTAYADLDPRENFGTCGFTSTEETWEPDASGTLVKRVTYASVCDAPAAGDETITVTTEEWNGATLETTEVREAVRTLVGGIYFTTTEIFDGSMALIGKEDHTYDYGISDSDVWFQDWTYYNWNGASFDLFGYTTKTVEWLVGEDMEITFVYYDTTFRADPVIPDDVPVLGSSTSSPMLPPPGKGVDHIAFETLGRMYERVRNTMIVNPNTQREGIKILSSSNEPISHGLVPPPGVYVAGVLKGDRVDDFPGIDGFNGFWTRWVRFSNDVAGNLTALFGWTSDRDLNEPTSDWWQARVRQDADGTLEIIENAHRSGLTEEDHYDTYTVLNSMYMIDSQTVKIFDYHELNPGDFTETTTVTDGMAAPVSFDHWTVVFD
jgi:hypothetical protein